MADEVGSGMEPTSPNAKQQQQQRRGVKKRGTTRGKLRRTQEIGSVVVEDTFAFTLPYHVAATSASSQYAELKDGAVVPSEGCYISTTVHNRRYYGVLIDQASLKRASLLHFQDEASGLDLNRRMEYLIRKQQVLQLEGSDVAVASTDDAAVNSEHDLKRSAPPDSNELYADDSVKRRRLDDAFEQPEAVGSKPTFQFNAFDIDVDDVDSTDQAVQKFRYVLPNTTAYKPEPGYRILLATYANVAAAAEEDYDKQVAIAVACRSGGNFVGDYYYQYEVKSSTLVVADSSGRSADDSRNSNHFRMSLGFSSFLQTTPLPNWFPLTNLQVGQQKVLSLLSMKKDSSGNLVYDDSIKDSITFQPSDVDRIPMEARSSSRYRVCVVGGGIAGLSCCLELFRICERDRIEIEVVLVEGRSRLGGRLWTDHDTFTTDTNVNGSMDTKSKKERFPVDLGASWIHGINMNPLADLAREAGADFVTTSEDVKMFESGAKEVDKAKDENAGRLFDKLLDLAAHDCWSAKNNEAGGNTKQRKNQAVIRWYASQLGTTAAGSGEASDTSDRLLPPPTSPPPHRQSNDVAVDVALGRVIMKHQVSEFSRLSDEERNMLTWNTKNVEYALGANIKDVSMKFWDIDERHAFEGDHVLLRQGYSTIVDHLHRVLKQRGDRFTCHLNFAVGKVEYNRKTTTQTYIDLQSRNRKFVELSDCCSVTSRDGEQSIYCDFVVSAVPLGVLKMSMQDDNQGAAAINFEPPLPFLKRDAIEAVGFGLLNKVYLQFPFAFWRIAGVLEPNQTQFGNASGVNPQHYMFLDIGRTLGATEESAPAILMSLISGREAAICEQLDQTAVVAEVMETLKALFSGVDVVDPIAFKVTAWGTDPFSRGSYTFLTPGTTDDDFEALQSPVNGNGDSLLLEGLETMRLFFAGEHTTALHPSMAHGAQLSGVRAAKEIADSIILNMNTEECDHLLPMSMFRYMNPKRALRCCMCHRSGTSMREGKLLAFKKGSRQIICHLNCAENSPEVEVFEGKWKDVFSAATRSSVLSCFACRMVGASINCGDENCKRLYHFSCAEDTGWRFQADGKEFRCDVHRTLDRNDSCRVSISYFKSKEHNPEKLLCALCESPGIETTSGELLAFQRHINGQEELTTVHENCIKHTSIMDLGESDASGMDKDFGNVFSVISKAMACSHCGKRGATIGCSSDSCNGCYHFVCALDLGWNFEKRGPKFLCSEHRSNPNVEPNGDNSSNAQAMDIDEATSTKQTATLEEAPEIVEIFSDEDSNHAFEEVEEESNEASTLPADIPLVVISSNLKLEGNRRGTARLGRLSRATIQDRWNVELYATCTEGSIARVLRVAASAPDPFDQFEDGDVVKAINGRQVGSPELDSLQKVFTFLSQEVDAMLEIRRFYRPVGQWY